MKITAREKILRERGLTLTQSAPHKSRRMAVKVVPDRSKPKTTLMKYLEQKYNLNLEDVLVSASLSMVAKKLGDEVDVTTLSKWIKRLKLRYTKDNLPDCRGCRQYGVACEGGICYVLMRMELYDLVDIKKEELLNEGNQPTNQGA